MYFFFYLKHELFPRMVSGNRPLIYSTGNTFMYALPIQLKSTVHNCLLLDPNAFNYILNE